MRGFKSIFVSSKHKIKCFLIHEKYFQTTNAVDTLPLTPHRLGCWRTLDYLGTYHAPPPPLISREPLVVESSEAAFEGAYEAPT